MGSGYYDNTRYSTFSSTIASRSREEVFSRRNGKPEFLPNNIKIREALDNEDHPESNAIAIGVDVTGSMGYLADSIVKGQLGTLMTELINREPVKDPQVCFMAIGDIVSDKCPLQITQFESDDRIADQITELWLEGNGGGNGSESYIFPWLFALNSIKADCIEKRNKKGYIITMGDEQCPSYLYKSDLSKHLDMPPIEGDSISAQDLYRAVSEKYNVFHLIIEEGSYCKLKGKSFVLNSWNNIIGKRAIPVRSHKYLSEIIVSLIQINEGMDPEDVICSWEDSDVVSDLRYAFGL